MMRRWLVVAGLAGCSLQPDVGARLAGTCDDTDTAPAAAVSFARDIRPLITRTTGGCFCHLPTAGQPGPATQITGLDLSTLDSLRAGGEDTDTRIVVSGQPCASFLYLKLSTAPPFGSRMPLNGPPFFSAEELRLVHDWIAEGAGDN